MRAATAQAMPGRIVDAEIARMRLRKRYRAYEQR
jgi:hypothetical protein